MAYIPTEWFNGDTITAEKLNNIENGIGRINNSIDSTKLGINSNKNIFVSSSSSSNPYGEWKTLEQIFNVTNLAAFKVLSVNEEGSFEILDLASILGAEEASINSGTDGFLGYNKDWRNLQWYEPSVLSEILVSALTTTSLRTLADALAPYLSSSSSEE